jgi:hypothetical protein
LRKSAEEMFEHEVSAVFVRWWEESDLDELQMSQIAIDVIERFCDTTVEFDADFHWDANEMEEENNVGPEDDQETE